MVVVGTAVVAVGAEHRGTLVAVEHGVVDMAAQQAHTLQGDCSGTALALVDNLGGVFDAAFEAENQPFALEHAARLAVALPAAPYRVTLHLVGIR